MKHVVYPTEEQIILMDTFLIKNISPDEMVGLREPSALNMSIQSMKQIVLGEEIYPSIEEKAAILWINLIRKHCFHNGNKRTAYMALHAFLRQNHLLLQLEAAEAADLCVEIATWEDHQFNDLKTYIVEIIKTKTSPLD